jgi:hypothetical protein
MRQSCCVGHFPLAFPSMWHHAFATPVYALALLFVCACRRVVSAPG